MSDPVEVECLGREYAGSKKSEAPVVALNQVSLNIAESEILGLLGPNGAGKTTLVKVLSTVLLPTSGSAKVMGFDVVHQTSSVRPLIGIVFGGERGLYTRLTARQNLRYWAALYKLDRRQGVRRVEELLERVGLTERGDSRVETFSRGMKQRLHLARGMISNPPVLFLDEPTTGMDPVAARRFRELVTELRSEGRTILLTTHDMAEAESVCDRVALIDHGKLLAIEKPRTLGNWLTAFERIDVQGANIGLLDSIASLDGVVGISTLDQSTARIELSSAEAHRTVIERLVAAGIVSIKTSLPSLEEVYLHVFGGKGMGI